MRAYWGYFGVIGARGKDQPVGAVRGRQLLVTAGHQRQRLDAHLDELGRVAAVEHRVELRILTRVQSETRRLAPEYSRVASRPPAASPLCHGGAVSPPRYLPTEPESRPYSANGYPK